MTYIVLTLLAVVLVALARRGRKSLAGAVLSFARSMDTTSIYAGSRPLQRMRAARL
jgi:hypothetical protein